jgi:hypothetical protein
VYRTERYQDLVAKVRRLQGKVKDEDAARKPGEKVKPTAVAHALHIVVCKSWFYRSVNSS